MAASGRLGRTLSKSTAKKQFLERNFPDQNTMSTVQIPTYSKNLTIPRSVSSPGASTSDCPRSPKSNGSRLSPHLPISADSVSVTSPPTSSATSDYKIILFGSSKVGKSSLIKRFTKGVFTEQYAPTIEDAYRQVISYNKQIFYLQIIDTSGGYQFPAMHRLSIETGNAFVLVYSVTSKESLLGLEAIHEDIQNKRVPVILVGNKADDLDKIDSGDTSDTNATSLSNGSSNIWVREVTTEEGKAAAEKWHCDGFLETSARRNFNVKELFQELIQAERAIQMSDDNTGGSRLHRTRSANKSFRLLSQTGDKLNKRCHII